MSITERIEDAMTESLLKGQVPTKLFLGKSEFESYMDESESRRILFKGVPSLTMYRTFINQGALDIEPTEQASEFRFM